jgi:hypothetical protein
MLSKQSKVRASLVVVGACLSACAGADASSLDDPRVTGDGVAEEALAEEVIAADEAILDSPSADLELGTLEQQLGGACGSESTPLNSVFYYTTVPDHFPPDSAVAELAAAAIGVPLGASAGCALFGVAELHDTCDAHDSCYDTLGAPKADCDDEARRGWRRECERTYDTIGIGTALLALATGSTVPPAAAAEQICREACLLQAEAMYLAVAAAGQSAYDAAQADARAP